MPLSDCTEVAFLHFLEQVSRDWNAIDKNLEIAKRYYVLIQKEKEWKRPNERLIQEYSSNAGHYIRRAMTLCQDI